MIKKYGIARLLFKPDTGGGGGGANSGGGTGGLLNTGGGTQGTNVSGTGGDPNKNADGTGDKSGGNASAGGGEGTANWISSLPKELQEDATLKKFNDVQGLAKSYLNAQKLIGADKIPVPNQHATEEDWQNVYKKLGLPDLEKYEVKFGDQATIDKKFVDDFKQNAHKLGILPKQAQGLATWFSEMNAKAENDIIAERKTQNDKEIGTLKQEWGNAFNDKLQYAQAALDKYADPDVMEYLAKTGLNNDVRLVKLLNKLGEEIFKEGSLPNGGESQGGMTPADARKAAQAIIADRNHPYHNKQHANHKAAVQEVQDLFQQAAAKST